MNENLNITIKIGGAAQGLNEVKTLSNGIKTEMDKVKKSLSISNLGSFNTFKSGVSDIQSGLKGLGNQAVIAGTAVGTTLAGAAAYSAKTFINFEDQLANVRKTVGLTAEQTKKVGDELIRYSQTTRTSISELVDIATVGGQLGVAEKDVLSFTKAIDKLAVALGDEFLGGATQITQEVGVLRNLFTDIKSDKIDQDLLKIGNALNVLGTRGLATAPVVTDFATRISGLTGGLKVSSGDVLGLSAALQELGINAERGGSNVGRIFNILAKDADKIAKTLGLNVKDFKRLVNTDINEAFLTVAKRVRELGTENTKFSQLLEELGLDAVGASEVLQKVGGSIDQVRSSQEAANSALDDTNSILDEYNTKNSTTQGNLNKLSNTLNGVAIAIGGTLAPYIEKLAIKFGEFAIEYGPKVVDFFKNSLIPAARDVVDFLKPIIEVIFNFIQQNPGILQLAAAFAALTVGIRGFNLVFGPAMTLLGGLGKVILSAIANIPMVQAGMTAIGQTISGSAGLFGGAFKTAFAGIPWASIAAVIGPIFGFAFAGIVGNELGKLLAEQKWFKDLTLSITGQAQQRDKFTQEADKLVSEQQKLIKEVSSLKAIAAQRDPAIQTLLDQGKISVSELRAFVAGDFKTFKDFQTSSTGTILNRTDGIGVISRIASDAKIASEQSRDVAKDAIVRIKSNIGITDAARINAAGAKDSAQQSNFWAHRVANTTVPSAVSQLSNVIPPATRNQITSSPIFTGLKLIGNLFGLKFAQGGIVPGSAYNGDKVVTRVNSGEMILNRDQQANLFKMFSQPQQQRTVNFNGNINFGGDGGRSQYQQMSLFDSYLLRT